MVQAQLDAAFQEVFQEHCGGENNAGYGSASFFKTCPIPTCGKSVSRSNFSRHLDNHRKCIFCSKQSGAEVFHMIKNIGDCPFFDYLLRRFYPRYSEK